MTYFTMAALTCALSLTGTAAAQSSSPVPLPAGSAKIHGQILHPVGKVVTVQVRGQKVAEVPVDAAGRFNMTVPLKEASPAKLETGNEYTNLWLAPGDDLTLALDAKQFDETVKYTGVGARVNNFLAAEVLAAEPLEARTEAAEARSPAGFGAFVDSVKTARTAQLTAALSPQPTPAETAFLIWKRRELTYDWAAERLSYGQDHPLAPTDPYYAFLSDPAIPLDNPVALTSEAYRAFVSAALSYHARTAGATASGSSVLLTMLRQGAQRLSPAVQASVLPNIVLEGIDYLPFAVADSLQRAALAHLSLSAEDRGRVEAAWTARQLTRVGLAAPDLHATAADGKPFKWESVRGKVVYLDLWASWCGPCIGEMPAARKLHAALHDRAADVVFLNVSVDGSAANWQKGITKHNVEGQNLHSAGDFNSPALKAYGISAIPRYLLIGPDGRILDGNAPRPSGGAEAAIRAALAAKK